MQILVVKFGGSCLATPEKIKKRAQLIKSYKSQGHKVLVVVSAMGQSTNKLVELAYSVSSSPQKRELDMLLTTGERVSMSLLSMVLNDLDCPAISFTGSQAGILTESDSCHAKINEIKPIRVVEELSKNKIVIIAGFQGVDPINKEITTLGRGGSDTTAMAFAKYFEGECHIFKDVAGICNADPNYFSSAQTLQKISHDQLLNLCNFGTEVLHLPAISLAKEKNINYQIVEAENPNIFTKVSQEPTPDFNAISLAKNICQLSNVNFNFSNWCIDNHLNPPNFYQTEKKLCFWGDFELCQPVEQQLQKDGISYLKDLHLVSLFSSKEKLESLSSDILKHKYDNNSHSLHLLLNVKDFQALIPRFNDFLKD